MTAFESLRRPSSPTDPDPGFAARLRARITAELAPTVELPDRTTPPTPTTAATAATAATATGPQESTVTDTTTIAPTTVTITPYLAVHDAAAAIGWYAEVFAAREMVRYTGDDGRVGHAELDLGGATIYLSDEYPDHGVTSARTLGGAGVSLNTLVPDVDAVWERAIAAGADGVRPPEDQPYGERSSVFVDPFGHRWMVQTTVATPTNDEIEAAFDGAFTVTAIDEASATPTAEPVEIGYVTFPVDDTARAGAFYAALFGWATEGGHQGDDYAHVANTRLPMGFTPDGNDGAPEIYFRVDDADRYAARVVELGGEVLERSEHESGGGVTCRDAQGRRFRLWQPAPGY